MKFLEIVKEIIISLLLVACVGVIGTVVFYNKLALGKVIPEAEEYSLSSEMQNELKNSKLDVAEENIINYYIDASDLKKYEKTNEYIKGKSNPFAEVSGYDGENNSSSGDNSIVIENNANSGFYEDDGTK